MRKFYYPILVFLAAYLLIALDVHAETCTKSSNFRDIMKINQQLKLKEVPKQKVINLNKS